MAHKIEVFTTGGCPDCDETVNTVKEVACPDCEVVVYDLRQGGEGVQKAAQYEVPSVPTVVMDGRVLTACDHQVPTREELITAGISKS